MKFLGWGPRGSKCSCVSDRARCPNALIGHDLGHPAGTQHVACCVLRPDIWIACCAQISASFGRKCPEMADDGRKWPPAAGPGHFLTFPDPQKKTSNESLKKPVLARNGKRVEFSIKSDTLNIVEELQERITQEQGILCNLC